MHARFWIAAAAIGSLTAGAAAQTQTIRYDFTTTPLAVFNFEFTADYLFPIEATEVTATRLHIEFQTNTFAGEYDAANMGLYFQAPVQDPSHPTGLATVPVLGSDLGFSGNGVFTADVDLPALNGMVIPALPGDTAFLYGITYFHGPHLTNPDDFTPMGGQHLNSYLEVDYIPAPATAAVPLVAFAALRRRRR